MENMEDMEKILFLYNSHAGKGRIKEALSDIVELFVNANYEVTIHSTKGKGDAKEVANQRGMDYDIIVVSGGDGTLNEVVNGIMPLEKKPDIGYIPAGTMNDFAMNFQLSKINVNAAKTVVIGKPFPYDVGSFNGTYFNYVASFGIFASVSYSTPQAFKNAMGKFAYFVEGAKSLASIESYSLRLEYDDNVIEDEFIFGMISNANSVGGFKNITGKNVCLYDGLFEVMFIKKPKNIIEFNSILSSLIMQDYKNNNIYKFKASKINIESYDYIDWTLDGEFGGYHEKVEVINHKQAVNFLVEENIITELINDNEYEEPKRLEFVEPEKIKNIAKNFFKDIKEDDDENKEKRKLFKIKRKKKDK